MKRQEANQWLERSEKRKRLLMDLKQPMTAMQLSKSTGLSLDQCSLFLGQLLLSGLVKCLNPYAKRSRLYWLTPVGIFCQKKLRDKNSLPSTLKDLPDIDWQLYGWVCYNHRSAIIRTLTEPMQAATIKRKARQNNPKLKMSANNARDVTKLLLQKGILRKIFIKKKAHPRYELTDLGNKVRSLLLTATVQL